MIRAGSVSTPFFRHFNLAIFIIENLCEKDFLLWENTNFTNNNDKKQPVNGFVYGFR